MNGFRSKERIYFFTFIVSQPVIDVLTGIMTRHVHTVITPGAFLRGLLLLVILPYIWKELRMRPLLRGLFLSSFITISCTATLSLLLKQPFLWKQEGIFYMKTAFYIASLFFIIITINRHVLSRKQLYQAVTQLSLIIGGSYVLAYVTKTSFPSYPYGELGFSGWFFSANELSVIVILTLAGMLTITRERPTALADVALFLLTGVAMFTGTKTAYIGAGLLFITTIIDILMSYPAKRIRRSHGAMHLIVAGFFFISFPFVPMTKNQVMHVEQVHMDSPIRIEKIGTNLQESTQMMLSSRDVYVSEIAQDFSDAPLVRKLFGLGLAGDYGKHPKMIEMDFFELFFSFGIIGSFVLFLPFLTVIGILITRISFTRKNWVLLVGLVLSVLVAAVSGHVLFAPSVMSYVVITTLLLHVKDQYMPKKQSI